MSDDEVIPIEEADQVAKAKKAPAKKAARTKSPAAKQRKPPTDLTGVRAQQEAERLAEEQREAAERMTLINPPEPVIDDSDEVTDLTDTGAPAAPVEVEDEPVAAQDDDVVITVNSDLSDLTFGAGTLYNLRAGKRYRVPRALAEWLEEKGYVWH